MHAPQHARGSEEKVHEWDALRNCRPRGARGEEQRGVGSTERTEANFENSRRGAFGRGVGGLQLHAPQHARGSGDMVHEWGVLRNCRPRGARGEERRGVGSTERTEAKSSCFLPALPNPAVKCTLQRDPNISSCGAFRRLVCEVNMWIWSSRTSFQLQLCVETHHTSRNEHTLQRKSRNWLPSPAATSTPPNL